LDQALSSSGRAEGVRHRFEGRDTPARSMAQASTGIFIEGPMPQVGTGM